MAYASPVDLDEAYAWGRRPCELAAARPERLHGHDPPRIPAQSTSVRYDKVPLAEVANSERTFPAAWIAPNGCDVTDDFVRYARPLVGNDMISLPMIDGRQRLTRFAADLTPTQKLPKYVPQADRNMY